MRLSISARLTIAFTIAALVLLGGGATFLYLRIAAVQDRSASRDVSRRWDQLVDLGGQDGTPAARAVALVQAADGPAQAYDPSDGSVLTSSRATRDIRLLDADDVKRAGRTSREYGVHRDGHTWLVRVGVPGKDDPVIAVAADRTAEHEAREALAIGLAVGAGIAVLLAGLAAFLLARRALAPVEAMRRRAADLARDSNHGLLPEPESGDELTRLAQTLNVLLSDLHRSVDRERRFVADAGHELRTPIALLLAEIELALERPREPSAYVEALGTLESETRRLARLAEQLLALGAQAPEPVRRSVDLAELAQLAADRAQRAANRGADASVELTVAGDTRVSCDPEQVERAISNLVDNAFAHGAAPVSIEVERLDHSVVVRVMDRGDGFAPEFVERATERFTRADEARSTRGAGLGLSIVDATARANGGIFRIRHPRRGGASVELEFPAATTPH